MISLPILVPAVAAAAVAGVAAWGAIAPPSEIVWPRPCGTRIPLGESLSRLTMGLTRPSLRSFSNCWTDIRPGWRHFFWIGKFVLWSFPELALEISVRGHLLGNHTESASESESFQSRVGIREELERCHDAISAATRTEPPRWMRPPYGYRNPFLDREVHRAGLRGVVMWSKACWDWKPQPPERLIRRLAHVARPGKSRGDVVLLHDGDHRAPGGDRRHVVAALEHWLPRWRDAGIEFVTIE